MDTTILYEVAGFGLAALITLGISAAKQWQATAAAQKHPAVSNLLTFAESIGNDALAALHANPAMTPAAALAWAVGELKARAPEAIVDAKAAQPDLVSLATSGLLAAAGKSNLTTASMKVITALAPGVSTVAPAAIEDVTAALLAKFPGLAALAAPPVPVVAIGDPQPVQAAAAAAV